MCANYQPPPPTRFREALSALEPTFEYRDDIYPGYDAPILLLDPERADQLVPHRASFGLVPHWARDKRIARQTCNARTETVAEKPSFRTAWKQRQFCLIPADSFYEPRYTDATHTERWRIHCRDRKPFALAGLWSRHRLAPDQWARSFTMLTINAADHPLMAAFHAPDDEKRCVVILPAEHWHDWLAAADEGQARALLRGFDAGLFTSEAAPRAKPSSS